MARLNNTNLIGVVVEPPQIAKDPEYQKELAELGLKPSYMAAEEYSQEVHGIFKTIQDILK